MHNYLNLLDTQLNVQSPFFTSRLARPLCIIEKDKKFLGFLMKEFNSGCTFEVQHNDGTSSTQLQEINYFLGSAQERIKLGVPSLAPYTRLKLLDDFLKTVSQLHKLEIVVGDISGKNLLLNFKVGAKTSNRVVFLDVDSFRLASKPHPLGTESTLNWWAPENIQDSSLQSTKSSDVYKAALLVKRFLHHIPESSTASYNVKKSSPTKDFLVKNEGQVLLDVLEACSASPKFRPSAQKLSFHFSSFVKHVLQRNT
jgi:serine/threonine protein kinase